MKNINLIGLTQFLIMNEKKIRQDALTILAGLITTEEITKASKLNSLTDLFDIAIRISLSFNLYYENEHKERIQRLMETDRSINQSMTFSELRKHAGKRGFSL